MDEPSEELPRRRSLIDETARTLRLAIARGTWVEFLPGERELSRRFQVSRPTLRAALGELSRDGEIERSPRQRCRILNGPRRFPVGTDRQPRLLFPETRAGAAGTDLPDSRRRLDHLRFARTHAALVPPQRAALSRRGIV